MKHEFYLSLGSNMGERGAYISQALELLEMQKETLKLCKVSSFYETDPVGYLDQGAFLNIAVYGKTSLQPLELLAHTQSIENTLGRLRSVRWGPRVIDIDILLYNSIRMRTDDLVLPHPRMTERTFVLVPLVEIAPELRLPDDHYTIGERIQQVGKEGVRLWKTN
ncbi:2-amino-4-hydroxy-6-hydroxymethyldihydropteridine diphosphokinase [Bacillus horti]|uniref:2-amino-4-hydroxy-6-hydroxymethyldihydropteridine diphosphokinase n=1 Tax=Caldalkalibacillus horti TaxID=77523 RepID=A0ABT9W2Z1_9BACI|nr:2-amino-4-hydroxy-6-hydroxymethyldihydropteridine diphosphokinase [Bacillus horti]MDQ0167616.1 2-amino-4-hydroxy-6-hydroxymethyldihydropteridine diphosphokinase [Bacillus horti]